jgi:uncharacterized membrane protein
MFKLAVVLLLAVHILAAVFWVGGMAFAYMILRPAAGALEPPARLPLWRRVFARFLPWVGVSVAALVASGFAMIFMIFGGMRATPHSVHLMLGAGLVMTALYLHLVFAPWPRLREAVDRGAFAEAAKALNQIRRVVGINLILGVITVLLGGTGRYW